jgi:hypothetical protein
VSPNKPCGILRNVVNPRQPLRNSATQAQFACKNLMSSVLRERDIFNLQVILIPPRLLRLVGNAIAKPFEGISPFTNLSL